MAEVGEISGGSGAWNLRFLRSFNDWEMSKYKISLVKSITKESSCRKKDRLVWKGDKNDQFTVKAYCSSLEGVSSLKAPIKILWYSYVLPKVGFLAWEAWWAKVLTMQQHKKRDY